MDRKQYVRFRVVDILPDDSSTHQYAEGLRDEATAGNGDFGCPSRMLAPVCMPPVCMPPVCLRITCVKKSSGKASCEESQHRIAHKAPQTDFFHGVLPPTLANSYSHISPPGLTNAQSGVREELVHQIKKPQSRRDVVV